MNKIQLLPVWAFLALVFTGCSVSRNQCPPQQRQFEVRNWTFRPIAVNSSGMGTNYTVLGYDDSVVYTQVAKDGFVPAFTIGVGWSNGVRYFNFPLATARPYYNGDRYPLDLTEKDGELVICCP